MVSRAGSFLGHFDCDLRTIGLGEPGLVLKPLGNGAVADFVRIAEFVELEQFGRQRFAARVSLTLLLVNAHLQCGGFRHSTNLPLSSLASALLTRQPVIFALDSVGWRAVFFLQEL